MTQDLIGNKAVLQCVAVLCILVLVTGTRAQSALWDGTTSDWNTASNWLSAIPGSTGYGLFASVGVTSITFSAPITSVGAIEFQGAGSTLGVTGAIAA